MKARKLIFALWVAACGRTGLIESTPPPAPPPAQPGGNLPSGDVPLFYPTIRVGALSDHDTDDVSIDVDVRTYGELQPGPPVELAPGESLTLNGAPLTRSAGGYSAQHLPIAADGIYAIDWVRPSGTIAFNPIAIAHLTLTAPAIITAGTAFDLTTAPVVDGLELHTSTSCAEPMTNGGFEGGGGSGYRLTLLQQPCTTDLGVTHTTNWDVAFIDPSTQAVIGRGHVGLVAMSSAWRSVTVTP